MLEIPNRLFCYAFMALVVILWARAERLHRRDSRYLQEQDRLRALPLGHFLRRTTPWVRTRAAAKVEIWINISLTAQSSEKVHPPRTSIEQRIWKNKRGP